MTFVWFMANNSDVKVALDGETEVTSSLTNKATKSSIMSGASVSDGFTEGNEVIKVTGVVSYTKTTTQEDNPTPAEYRGYIEEAIKSKNRFSVYFKELDGTGTSLLDTVDNCVITNRSYAVNKYTNTLIVSITFEAQYITDAAETTLLTPVVATTDESSVTHDSEATTASNTALSDSETEDIFVKIQNVFSGD